ncbi:hypothetical protein [Microcoleus sp. herbarium5]|uniref:hypothetical protein n=1 Tax=Microcoleus sp. herbarium5 TaxID=3055434 RepID=UPI002FCFD8A9
MQIVLLKCVMQAERSIARLHNATQKPDRTFYTIYSKGRSHFLHNLLKRSIARRGMMQVEKPLPSPSQPSKCLRSQGRSIPLTAKNVKLCNIK